MLNSISVTEKKSRMSLCWSEESVVSPGTQMENEEHLLFWGVFCFVLITFLAWVTFKALREER